MTALFEGIHGHERAKEILTRALASGRMPHAWLFAGRAGVGKGLMAQRFVQALACSEGRVGEGVAHVRACQSCRHCVRIAAEQHPDLIHVRPEGATILIKQVRDLQQATAFDPFEARHRVIVLHEAHTLGEASANALLKTLEEPGGRTLFVLLSAQPQHLLPTIVSRCQTVRFAPFDVESLRGLLVARGVSADKAARVAVLAEGSLGEALQLAEHDDFEGVFAVIDAIRQLDASDPAGVLELASQLAVDREQVEGLLTVLQTWYRDLLWLASGGEVERLALSWRAAESRALAAACEPAQIELQLEQLEHFRHALRSNVNLTLGVEHVLFSLCRLMQRVRASAGR